MTYSPDITTCDSATGSDIEEGIFGTGNITSDADADFSAFDDFLESASTEPPKASITKSVGWAKGGPKTIAASSSQNMTGLDNPISSSSLGNSKDASKLSENKDDFHENGSHDDHGAHGHAGPTFMSKLASSIVCFIIYFVFCIVFSSVVWDPLNSSLDVNINPSFGVPQGVGINLMGIAVGCVFFAWKSGCKAVMAGPDLLPIVFVAEAGTSVMAYLVSESNKLGHTNCGDNASSGAHRFLGGGGDAGASDPCSAFHRSLAADGPYLDETFYSMVVPTTLVAMMIGNAVTGLLFYGLGKMKHTASVIGCMPASVVAGFLTCIGYKVRLNDMLACCDM
mmetsp:Transcript_24677/g.53232  ORF Transcript_24677/g.53232 Transcript_24677/m.53232 type:complete len:338 (+) Transcript_24677:170-1183(+)